MTSWCWKSFRIGSWSLEFGCGIRLLFGVILEHEKGKHAAWIFHFGPFSLICAQYYY